MTRVLFVGQSYIAGDSRQKLARLAQHPGYSIGLVVPSVWEHESFGRYVFQPTPEHRAVTFFPIPIRNNGRVFAFSYHLRALWRAIQTFQPEILHVEQEPGSLVLLQFVALKFLLRRVKLIAFTWENLFYCPPALRDFLERIELPHLDYLLVGSADAAQVARQKNYRGPLAVLPNVGVDAEQFAPRTGAALRATLNIHARYVIGFVGRLAPEKGCLDLLRAFAQMPDDCHLLFVGSGALRDDLARRADELGVAMRVTFQPAVPHARVADFLNALDVLVLPSRTTPQWREQFGLVLAQAMSCGVPVIGANSGAIPEVIGDAGLIFPEGAINALRDHLARVRDDPGARAELSARGRARVLALFTHERIAEQTLAIYRQLGVD
ncbi:MAG: glycosyltransferase family 4 protein [Chloroflexi bacterium]|nr:glycosyltransferase family 4 protein [Chloroflexota bacterium]